LLRVDNIILGVALRTGYFCRRNSFLLLINPSLNASLMNPFSGSSTPARLNPLGSHIVFIRGEAYPTVSLTKIGKYLTRLVKNFTYTTRYNA